MHGCLSQIGQLAGAQYRSSKDPILRVLASTAACLWQYILPKGNHAVRCKENLWPVHIGYVISLGIEECRKDIQLKELQYDLFLHCVELTLAFRM